MKLTKTTILECLLRIKVDHSIQISEQDLDAKVQIMFDDCQILTNEQFIECSERLRKTNLFGKLPSSSNILEMAGIRELTLQERARSEAQRVIDNCEFSGKGVIFDDPTTNAAVRKYTAGGSQGIRAIYWDLFASCNDKLKRLEWVRKELAELWLDCLYRKQGDFELCHNRDYGEILFVGDKEKIEKQTKLIENNA